MALPTLEATAPEETARSDEGLSPELAKFLGGQSVDNPTIAELVEIAKRHAPRADKQAPAPAPSPKRNLPQRNPLGPPISPDTIVTKVGTLASLPNIYFQVDKAINHPASSTALIGRILSYDQALCARLLRIANSAFYGFSRRVESIEDAVRIIGTRQLHDMVLATVVLSQFKGIDTEMVSMKSFWRHSLACSLAARALARMRRETNVERFFVAGLLHDIGSLAMYQSFPERAQLALERHHDSDKSLDETERVVFGCDHAAVGAALMTSWTLPPFYRDATSYHHSGGTRGHTPSTAVVHVADLLVQTLDLGSNGEHRLARLSPEARDLVGLPRGALEHAATEVLTLLGDIEGLFLGEANAN